MRLSKRFVFGAVAGLLGYEIWRCRKIGFRTLRVEAADFTTENFPPLSILHLSDLHLTATTVSRLEQLVFLAERKWDFVLISGDLIDDDSGIEPVCDFLGKLKADYGKFAVLGNHDFKCIRGGAFPGWINVFFRAVILGRSHGLGVANDVERLEHSLAASGVQLLRNEAASADVDGAGEVQIFGVDDPSTGRDRPEQLYSMKNPRALRLVLTHSPKSIAKLIPLQPELVLCGHTHAGQIRLPAFGALATRSDAGRKSCHGLVEIDGCRLHISPGIGAGRLFPLRLLARPEVTELIIKPRNLSGGQYKASAQKTINT